MGKINNKIFLSVVICTYNRGTLLSKALNSLKDKTLSKIPFEVIVVDNMSTDNTKELVNLFSKRNSKMTVTYILERKIGLSQSRNTGVKAAKGNFIAFLDDDAYVSSEWLNNTYQILDVYGTIISVLGGPILPYYEFTKPVWFKDKYEIFTLGNTIRNLKKWEVLSGSNMIIRKDLLETVGMFDTLQGMKGKYIAVGEETDLFEKLWNHFGPKLNAVYSSKLKVYHIVPEFKMHLGYRLKRYFMAGISKYLRDRRKNIHMRILFFFTYFGYTILQVFLSLINLFFYPDIKCWIIERLGLVIYGFAYLSGALGVLPKFNQRNNSI